MSVAHLATGMSLTGLFNELRRRNIFRVAGVYAVVSWGLAQASGVLEDAFALPTWFDTLVVSLLLIGFPIAMLLAWAFEMTPDGVKRTEDVSDGQSTPAKTEHTLDFVIIGGLVLVGVLIIGSRFIPQKSTAPDVTVEVQTDENLSIAVLPFEDFSAAKDQEYFANGISEELLNVLSRIDGLRVSSRTSAFAFKDRKASTGEIAEALNVGHILEGSIRKAGATLRITAQLIDTKTDEHMWSQTYDRPLTAENIFAIQDEIAAAIVAELKGQLSLAPAKQAPRTKSLEAYELYLRARQQMNKRLPETLRIAEAGFKQVTALDPEFAPGYSGLAETYLLMDGYTDLSVETGVRLAKPHVERALALAPNSAESLTTAALFATTEMRFDQALDLANRAIAANPNYADAYLRKSSALGSLGRYEESMVAIQDARALDPLSAIILNNLSVAQLRADNREAAKQTMRDNVRWNPDSPFGLLGLAALIHQDGDYAAAHSLYKDAQALNLENVSTQSNLASIYFGLGMYDEVITASKQPQDQARALFYLGKKAQSLKLAQDKLSNLNLSYILYLHGDNIRAYAEVRKFVTQSRWLEQSIRSDFVDAYITIAFAFEANGDADSKIMIEKVQNYLGINKTAADKILSSDLIAGTRLQILKGNADEAYVWLDRYLDLGFADLPVLNELAFDSLRGTPEFAKREVRMAENAAKHRALIEAQLANPKPNWVK